MCARLHEATSKKAILHCHHFFNLKFHNLYRISIWKLRHLGYFGREQHRHISERHTERQTRGFALDSSGSVSGPEVGSFEEGNDQTKFTKGG